MILSTIREEVRVSPLLLVLAGLVSVVFGLSDASPAKAEEFNPTNADELIASINEANGNDEADVINLVPGATYTLDERDNNQLGINGLPVISTEVEINGNGATIERGDRATGDFRILAIGQTGPLETNPQLAEVTLRDLTISGGRGSSLGGAILNVDSVLTITGCTITGNTADQYGGGVYSTTSDPQGSFQPQSRTTIVNSTVTNNRTSFAGGGVHNDEGYTEISYSTITDNATTSVQSSGGGVSNGFQTATNLTSNIVVGNRASTQQDDVGGSPGSSTPFQSGGYNLIGAGSKVQDFAEAGDQRGVSVAEAFGNGSPRLEDNGGLTPTVAIEEGSEAIDRVEAEDFPATDQRGVARPNGAAPDTGAFEFEAAPSPNPNPDPDPQPEPTPPTPEPGPSPNNPNACTIKGTPGNDVLRGTARQDVICSLGGRDIIYGLGGNDILRGGPGNDVLFGGPGRDKLIGGGGNDRLVGGPGKDRLIGGPGRNSLKQ